MAATIFYSWQSDLPNNTNRGFIERALQDAIKVLRDDIQLQDALRDEEIALDKDTQGVPGTPPIVDVIFNKISTCAAFVPDLTFVGKSKSNRMTSNPNVLIEYGWALKALTHAKILPVMNTAFGAATVENMPFDMRHLRNPITYHLAGDEDIETRNSIRQQLTRRLIEGLQLIIANAPKSLFNEDNAHVPKKSGISPADFENVGVNAFAVIDKGGKDEYLIIKNVEKLFLRLIPKKKIAPIRSSKAALDLIRKGHLEPFGGDGGNSFNRNANGAFAYQASEGGQVLTVSQLFLNGELWGIDAHTIDKEEHKQWAKVEFGYFPCSALERVFISGLTNYLSFAREILKLEFPVQFVAGATNVFGYRMSAPEGMYFGSIKKFAGMVNEQHLVYSSEIGNPTQPVTQILKPFFEYVWEACGLARPDRESL